MEPSDTFRFDENVGRPHRRISSILKATRTSVSDPEKAERQVEVAKPVEKRNSRRVSFAPANDVLLFSKDMKPVSPVSCPLLALSTSAAENVDKRFQFGIAEDGTQPITGMETLLKAPLHALQKKHKENFRVGYDAQNDSRERTVFTGDDSASMGLTRTHTKVCVSDAELRSTLPGRSCVGRNTQEDLGEKTMMYIGDDTGSMDMTHSNTIFIAYDSDSDAILPDQNCDVPTCGNLDFMFSLEKRKAETCGPAKITSSSACGLDPDFVNFLASISEPSGTRSNRVMAHVAHGTAPSPEVKIDEKELFAQLNAQRSGVDKENQAPTFTSKVMDKPQSKIRKSISNITSTNRSVVFSGDNDGTDMTEALMGHTAGSTSTDEPLQLLFPTPELYELSGHRSRTEVTLGQRSPDVQAYTLSDLDDMEITKSHTVPIDSKLCGMEFPSLSKMRSRLDQSLTLVPPITKSHMISQVFHNADEASCQGEHTRYDTSDSDAMEMTRSQTVAIDTKTVKPLQNKKRKSLAFMVPPNKASDVLEDECGMDMTKALTASIEHISHSAGSRMSANPFDSLFPQTNHKIESSFKQRELNQTEANSDDMEMTRSQTVAIDTKSLHTVNPLQNIKQKSLSFMVPPNKASNVLEDECGMDLTKALTVSIDHISHSAGSRMSHSLFNQKDHKIESSFKQREDNSDDMELTRSQTVASDTKGLHTVNPLQNKKQKSLSFMTAGGPFGSLGSNRTLLSEDDNGMEKTLCQGDGIGYNTSLSESDDMEMTRSQTVAIDTKSLHTVNPLQNKKQKSLSFMVPPNKASNVSEDECGMDLTKALTVSIDHISHSAGSRMSHSLFNQTYHKIESSFKQREDNSDDMELTRSQTVASDTKGLHTVNPLQNKKQKSLSFMTAGGPFGSLGSNRTLLSEDDNGMEKTLCQGDGIRYNTSLSESDDMEMTRSQTVAIDTKSLHTVNPLQNIKQKSLSFMVPPNKASNVSEDECGMDLTKALTVSIDHISHSAGSRMSANPLHSLFPQTNHKIESSFKQREDNSDDMELTRSQTVASDTKGLHTVNPLQNKKQKSLSFMTAGGPFGSLGSNRTLLSEDDNGMEKTLCQGDGIGYNTSLSESDDMEMTRSQTVAIDTKSLHTVNPLQNKKQKSLSFMVPPNKASNVSEDECGMDLTKALTVSIDHISHSAGSRMSANPLDSRFHQTNYKMEASFKQTEANSDDMDFTRSQTMVVEGRTLDVMKPSLIAGSRGPADILGSNGTLSESDTGIEETKATATAEHVFQIVSRSSQGDQTKAPIISRGNVVEEGDLSDKRGLKNDEKFITDSDDMDSTRSHTVIIDSEIPSMGHQGVPFKARKGLPSLHERTATLREVTPLSDLSAHVDMKIQLGPEGSSLKTDIMDPDDMELTRSQTVAIGSKHIDVADETPLKKSGNLDNFPQANTPFEHQSGASRSRAHSIESHVTDCRDNVLKGSTDLGDIEGTRDETISILTNHETFSRSVLSEGDEMTLTKALTMDIEHLNTARDAMISSQLPEGQCRATAAVNLPDSLDSKEIDNRKDPELTHENVLLSQGLESSPSTHPAADQVDNSSSRTAKTRRMSLADLQSKLKRVSSMINEPTETVPMDSCTEPLCEVEKALDKNAIKTKSLAVGDYDVMGITDKVDDDIQSEHFTEEEQPSEPAPLNLRSKSLISRLSMGCFMPKLPQRNKPLQLNQVESSNLQSVGERRKTNTMDITHELSSNKLMDYIEDEVLPNISSDEDLSEAMDTRSPEETVGKEYPHQGHILEVLEDNALYEESYPSVAQSKKRPFPEDCLEDTNEDEKRRKQTADSIQEMGPPSQSVTYNSNITAAPSITKTIDSSNSSNSTNLRCEATFESTFQQSVFQSHLEDTNDYTDDLGKKLQDESITVSEFFKLFNIDFLIHNPRQSILPAKLASDEDCQPEDLLRDRHITLPKQRVYETDCQSLTDKVDGLKIRMKDKNNLLKNVNRPLWEAVTTFSDKEMKCFGIKLKEKSNLFKRTSKVLSHEMKEGLYANLLHTSMEEQQKLRGKVEKADEVLKSLDDCIQELEAEIAAVEGTGQEDSGPTLKSRQQELENVNKDSADKERQKYELDEQKRDNVDQMNRLRTETRDLENHITELNRVIEWKFVERKANSTVYTFLYKTLRLEVVFDKSDGDDASDVSEQNISDITLQLSLDDDAECHAHLVHKLLSQYIDGEGDWVKKYPSSGYVPKLLHDVGLVVGRCRLLGEEVHLMKKWGALRLDILDISCVDTQVRFLFSSLKAFAKFELTIGVSSAYPFCLPQVHNFHSYIGNTTIHQLEEIVFSVTPAKNYLTKIVKKIHESLLC